VGYNKRIRNKLDKLIGSPQFPGSDDNMFFNCFLFVPKFEIETEIVNGMDLSNGNDLGLGSLVNINDTVLL